MIWLVKCFRLSDNAVFVLWWIYRILVLLFVVIDYSRIILFYEGNLEILFNNYFPKLKRKNFLLENSNWKHRLWEYHRDKTLKFLIRTKTFNCYFCVILIVILPTCNVVSSGSLHRVVGVFISLFGWFRA